MHTLNDSNYPLSMNRIVNFLSESIEISLVLVTTNTKTIACFLS